MNGVNNVVHVYTVGLLIASSVQYHPVIALCHIRRSLPFLILAAVCSRHPMVGVVVDGFTITLLMFVSA